MPVETSLRPRYVDGIMADNSATMGKTRFAYPVTLCLLVLNVVVFGLQLTAATRFPDFPLDGYFALSLEGLRHGFIWQLITYQFMHGGFWHIALNSFGIWIFGRAVEITVGSRRMVTLYFLSGIFGGIFQMAGTWLFPHLFADATVVGASAGLFGLVAAYAVLYPNEYLYLLLFFVIPLKLRARTLLRLFVLISLIGISWPWLAPHLSPSSLIGEMLGGNVAHAAHLGGITFGWFLTRKWLRRFRAAPPVIRQPIAPLDALPAAK